MEAERAVFLKYKLVAYANIHRVAIFHERDDSTVFGDVVECSGGLGLVHRVQSPVWRYDVGVYCTLREFGRRLGPQFVVVALGERYEAGVVDIHLAVFLAIEWEFKWQVYCYIVVEHIVAQRVLLAQAVGFDILPVEFNRAVVARESVGVACRCTIFFGECQVHQLVGGDRVAQGFVTVVGYRHVLR